MNFHMDYAKVVMQERMEEARQMRLLNEARQRAPKSPSFLSQMVSRLRHSNTAASPRTAQARLANSAECR